MYPLLIIMLLSGSRGVGGETKKGDDLKWPFSPLCFHFRMVCHWGVSSPSLNTNLLSLPH